RMSGVRGRGRSTGRSRTMLPGRDESASTWSERSDAVARTAIETGMARVKVDPAQIAEKVRRFVYENRDA
ncbi:MAG: hypothetical protein R6X34_17470, partial [Chloroflexota bacterium]